jgi:hypothetical protein
MKISPHAIAAIGLARLLCLATSAASAGSIVGVPVGFTPGTAPLVRIDPATGVYSTPSTTGNSYHALALNSAGDLYAGWFSVSAANGRVSRIDPRTGVPLETFNAATPGAGSIRGLSFDPSDRLLAVVNRDDAQGSPTLPDDLFEIDLGSETANRIGSLGFPGVQGLDFSPHGLLFAWDVHEGLLTVDPVTGAAADVNPAVGGTAEIQSIVFSPDGRLFGASDRLFGIDPATGSFAPIGAGGGPDIRGIEWIVPEPATSVLLLSGLLIMAVRAIEDTTPHDAQSPERR